MPSNGGTFVNTNPSSLPSSTSRHIRLHGAQLAVEQTKSSTAEATTGCIPGLDARESFTTVSTLGDGSDDRSPPILFPVSDSACDALSVSIWLFIADSAFVFSRRMPRLSSCLATMFSLAFSNAVRIVERSLDSLHPININRHNNRLISQALSACLPA